MLAMTVFLTGCAGMHSDFSCNATANEGCTPVDLVNDQAEYGVFDKRKAQDNELFRKNENVQRIWIAPFRDEAGNYHGSSYVYSIVKAPTVTEQDSWQTKS